MNNPSWVKRVACGLALAALGLAAGCNDDDGGKKKTTDVGLNDINKVLCIGDSITEGRAAPAGAPYPDRLAGLSGKATINAGIAGSTSDSGASRINSLLSKHKPGFVCILYGINDLDFGRDESEVLGNLQYMVEACKANKSVPVLATLMPTYDSHAFSAGRVRETNVKIRQLAKDAGARLCDLEAEFGSNRSLIQEDGLHPSDSGTQLIAVSFNDEIY